MAVLAVALAINAPCARAATYHLQGSAAPTARGWSATLVADDAASFSQPLPVAEELDVSVQWSSHGAPITGPEATPLRIRIAPTEDSAIPTPRWEVPFFHRFRGGANHHGRGGTPGALPPHALEASVSDADSGASIAVGRARVGAAVCGGDEVLSLRVDHYADQLIDVSFDVGPSPQIIGLGERKLPSLWVPTDGTPLAMLSTDIGTPELKALYGVHPFWMGRRECAEPSGLGAPRAAWYGVFFVNSNGMEASLEGDAQRGSLRVRTIGGLVDVLVVPGPTPADVVRQYSGIVGRPALPPRWALGWHQSRYGYRDLADLQRVVEAFDAASLPLDVVWADIDYMDSFHDFTIGPGWEGLPDYVAALRAGGREFVPIVDPGIAVSPGDPTYEAGIASDVFLRNGPAWPAIPGASPYVVGKVWPGEVHFPDFFSPNASSFWTSQFAAFHARVPFSGIWIDMNELASFCDGRCPIGPGTGRGAGVDDDDATHANRFSCSCQGPVEQSPLNDPPFLPGGVEGRPCRSPVARGLDCGTVSMGAVHWGGVREYDAHSLYGHMEAAATQRAVAEVTGRRPFVLTRSSFAGTGSFAAHWTGDNDSTWSDLRASITSILRLGALGMPMVGADACGFNGEVTQELCERWLQLAAWYPFARDHNAIGEPDQDPTAWGAAGAEVARAALERRYRLLPHTYTLAHSCAVWGGAVMRPLVWEWPDNAAALEVEERAFLWGAHILVTPALEESTDSVSVLLPAADDESEAWFGLVSGTYVAGGAARAAASGMMSVAAPLAAEAPAHVRGGTVIPQQQPANTSAAAAETPYTLLVAMAPSRQPRDGIAPGVAASLSLLQGRSSAEVAGWTSQAAVAAATSRLPEQALESSNTQLRAFGALYLDGGGVEDGAGANGVAERYAILNFAAVQTISNPAEVAEAQEESEEAAALGSTAAEEYEESVDVDHYGEDEEVEEAAIAGLYDDDESTVTVTLYSAVAHAPSGIDRTAIIGSSALLDSVRLLGAFACTDVGREIIDTEPRGATAAVVPETPGAIVVDLREVAERQPLFDSEGVLVSINCGPSGSADTTVTEIAVAVALAVAAVAALAWWRSGRRKPSCCRSSQAGPGFQGLNEARGEADDGDAPPVRVPQDVEA